MKKRFLSVIMCVAMIIAMFPQINMKVQASTYQDSCGENVQWKLDITTGLLIISGSGDMDGFPSYREYSEYITKVEIKSGVTSISSFAFEECNNLTNITIPESIKDIGKCAFKDCDSLKSITIPKEVSSIKESTFQGCSSLENITIPDSILSIEEKAFSECSKLEDIIIPQKVETIDGNIFEYCSNLKKIEVSEENTVYDSRDNCNAIIKTSTNELCLCQPKIQPKGI